jgi:uroporphyrinogen-III synthase
VPDGVCVNCALTGLLKDTSPIAEILERQGAEMLLVPAIQTQIGRVLDAGKSDADLGEIDWQAVLAAWDLPVEKGAGYGR